MYLKWIPFEPNIAENIPPEKRYVLVQLDREDDYSAPSVCVGYLKFAGGDRRSPYFVTPGISQANRFVTHWCDCLGDNFECPLWIKPKSMGD